MSSFEFLILASILFYSILFYSILFYSMFQVHSMGFCFRRVGSEVLFNIIEGRKEGRQGRGRPRMSFMEQIMEYAGTYSYSELKRLTQDREAWRKVANQSLD
ncbi:hypothetical protein M8J77_012197 [Diaphorina citri]|nr:hypothetical protein M8J77_012197 [Diaphorina citri]